MGTWLAVFVLSEFPAWISGQAIPLFDGSFYASGEILRRDFVADGERQKYETFIFEEVYDAVGRKGALRVVKDQDTITFLYDLYIKKQYVIRSFDRETTCTLADSAVWDEKNGTTQPLTIIHGPDGRNYTLLQDILVLKRYATVGSRSVQHKRGMFCRMFGFYLPNGPEKKPQVEAVVSWTLNETHPLFTTIGYTTPSPIVTSSRTPPGVTDLRSVMNTEVTKTLAVPWEVHILFEEMDYHKETMHARIFNFDYIRHASTNNLLQIPDGVLCEEYYNKKVFQPAVTAIRVLKYSAKVWNSKRGTHSFIKGWLDVDKRIFKLEYTPWEEMDPKPRTVIISGTNDRVYQVSNTSECRTSTIRELAFDPQMIMDPLYLLSKNKMTRKTFFFDNDEDAKLTYSKVTFKGGIPCHLWTRKINGWPKRYSYKVIETLWEWCFINKEFQEDRNAIASHLVSLDIHVLDAYPKKPRSPGPLETGQTLSFQFFDVEINPDKFAETQGVDVTPCCPEKERRTLMMTFEKYIPPQISRNADFLYTCWSKMVQFGGSVGDPYLYINKFQEHQSEKNESYLQFTLLGELGKYKINPKITEIIKKYVWRVQKNSLNFTYEKQLYVVKEVCEI